MPPTSVRRVSDGDWVTQFDVGERNPSPRGQELVGCGDGDRVTAASGDRVEGPVAFLERGGSGGFPGDGRDDTGGG